MSGSNFLELFAVAGFVALDGLNQVIVLYRDYDILSTDSQSHPFPSICP